MPKRVSIYKIAELAGVSSSTVSKVINGKKDVGEETRQKVNKIIVQMDFSPSMSKTMVDTIGIFMPIHRGAKFSNPYINGITSGILETAGDLDINVSIVDSQRIPKNPEDFTRFCRLRKISGGIFTLLTNQDNFIFSIASSFPTVTVSRDYGRDTAGCVMADNFLGGYEAIKFLITTGHRSLLLVNPNNCYPDHNSRMEGIYKALEESKLAITTTLIENSLEISDVDLGYRLDNILSMPCTPSAFFVPSDQEALRFMRLLGERNLSIPEDISIIGFDDLYFAANTTPPLTTIRQPLYEIGREACSLLVNMIQTRTSKKSLKVLKTELVIRKSVLKKN